MKLSSILVTLDNFWIGGRETFLIANLSLLKQHGATRVALLAEDIAGAIPRDIYENAVSIGAQQCPTIKAWLCEGSKLVKEAKPDLVWAQHYRVFPAWLLSVAHGIPLHITFHGPLLSVGGVSTRQDALGVALAIHRGGILTAVSNEIADELLVLGADKDKIRLMPNKVYLPAKDQERLRKRAHGQTIKLIMLTRQQKLGHIRAAVELLYAMRKKGVPAELTIYCGLKVGEETRERTAVEALNTAKRLGRKWLLANPRLIHVLPKIKFQPPISETAEAIEKSDVVLGMGRVVLEGLAASKPTVLVGYEQVIGLVTEESFSDYQYANFSGRGLAGRPVEAVAEQSIEALSAGNVVSGNIANMIDINESWESFHETNTMAVGMDWDPQLSKLISCQLDSLMKGFVDERQFTDSIYSLLSDEEVETYKALLATR